MIHNKDRSGWFGASDTAKMMGNWQTKGFIHFWGEKLGISHSQLCTRAMATGTHYEGRVLDFLDIRRRNRQIKRYGLRLRVNLDGEDRWTIYEIKTHRNAFCVTKAYWQQAQVEMFAARKRLVIVAYQVGQAEYDNFFLPIEPDRLQTYPVAYDTGFIQNEYLPRLRYLAWCLQERVWPNAEEYQDIIRHGRRDGAVPEGCKPGKSTDVCHDTTRTGILRQRQGGRSGTKAP